MMCLNCGGPIDKQLTFEGAHRYKDDCIAHLKRRVADLEPRAAFGDQCYQDRCENAYVEQSVLKRVEQENDRLRGKYGSD
jgi:hypothetical protein